MKSLTLIGVTTAMVGLGAMSVGPAARDRRPDTNADVRGHRRCDEGTLKGQYGVTLSGLRPGVGGALEQFVGVSMQTYDGQGNFTQTDNTHGPSAARTDQLGWGTYTVNPDCSGTKTLWLEGQPFAIENRLVIVDKGDEIRIVVTAPAPIVVSAVGRRVF